MTKKLYRIEDDHGVIIVSQHGNRRVLSFDSELEQSSVYLNKPYYLDHDYMQVMLLSLLFVEARHITLLGLGGGALVHCLTHYFPQMTYSVVELRQAVIDVAKEWFELPNVAQLQLHQSDAGEYLASNPDSTDIIFSDIFSADDMCESQGQLSYIESCYAALNEAGCLALNFHIQPETESPLMQKIHHLFTHVLINNTCNNNCVIFCSKNMQLPGLNALEVRAEQLAHKVNMPLVYYYNRLQKLQRNNDCS